MTKNLDNRKYRIIKEIMKIEDESSLSRIEHQIQELQEAPSIWQRVIVPTRKTISLEEMIEEQQYHPIGREDFFKLAQDLEIEESIGELLAQLD